MHTAGNTMPMDIEYGAAYKSCMRGTLVSTSYFAEWRVCNWYAQYSGTMMAASMNCRIMPMTAML